MPAGEQLTVLPPDIIGTLNSQEQLYKNEMEKPLQHRCGLGAVLLTETPYSSNIDSFIQAKSQISNILFAVRNRGQDSTGIAYVNEGGRISFAGGDGIVTDAFPPERPLPLADTYIGHVRYGTVAETGEQQQQPVLVSYNGWTMALAHNGNIPDKYRSLVRDKIPQDTLNREDLTLDSAELAWAIVTAPGETWEEKMHALDDIPCAFQLIMLAQDENNEPTIYSLADRTGMWPLVVGQNEGMIVMASEDTGISKGMDRYYVKPGQLVKANRNGIEVSQFYEDSHMVRCILQDAYGYNRESHLLPGLTGEDFSRAIGRQIGKELQSIEGNIVIAGVPQSGLASADGVAEVKGITRASIIEKNPLYEGKRTFIAKDTATRKKMAEEKYIVRNAELLKGAKLIVVDDSAVRGNTFRRLYKLLKSTRVSEIHFVSGLPKIEGDCDFGYYIKQNQSLLALKKSKGELQEGQESYVLRSDEEIIQDIIGVEKPKIPVFIHFLSQEGLEKVYCETMDLGPEHICTACIGGSAPDKLIQITRRDKVASA